MITIRKAASRGRFQNDWLDARFSFSFGHYQDPERGGYSDLLVLNDDRVRAGAGFPRHPHADIEAVTYPLSGEIEHRDTLGNVARLRPGDVQRMTAGRGIAHSEMNVSPVAPEHHLQFWIAPARSGLDPGYEQRAFGRAGKLGRLRLIASPDGAEGSLTLHQDARVFAAIAAETPFSYRPPAGRRTYLHVALGSIRVNGAAASAGDGLVIEAERALEFSGTPEGEFLLFDLR